MSERSGAGWRGDIGGNVPVQGDGEVDGLPWYFRARGTRWALAVAGKPDADPVATWADSSLGWLYREQFTDPDCVCGFCAGWMSEEQAWTFIEKAIGLYRAQRTPAEGTSGGGQ